MARGNFYKDSLFPFLIADAPSVTLSTTDLALLPLGNLPVIGSDYWWAGMKLRFELDGVITTGTTPGNGTFDIYWGSGAAANGTILASSAAFALTASQTNLTWNLVFDVTCRAVGGSGVGSLQCAGIAVFNNGVVASTLQPVMIPASAIAPVTVDLTLANVISPQFKRSGSTAEAMTVKELEITAMR